MAMTVSTAIWLGIDPRLSVSISLICELLIMIVAIGVALLRTEPFKKLWPLTTRQLGILIISTLVSYKALEVSLYGFTTNSVVYFGWYLLLLSVYSSISNDLLLSRS